MKFNLKSSLFSLKDEFKNFSLKKKISNEDFEIIWANLTDKINNESPSRIAFIGNCGVGKTSTIKSLFNSGREINPNEYPSLKEDLIEIKIETNEEEKEFIDIKNIPESDKNIKSQKKIIENYKEVLSDIDAIIWVLEVNSIESLNTQETFINDIRNINPTLINRIIFAINKIDIIHPDQSEWHPLMNLPSEEQEISIVEKVKDVEEIIKEIIPEWNGKIIGYSAEKKYNLTKLFKIVIDVVPEERKWVIASRKSLSEFYELVDNRFLPEELLKFKKKIITTIDNITYDQLPIMKNKVITYLYEMSEDELRIASVTEQSFEKAVAHLFQEVAYAKGYKIALPFAHATKIVENVWNVISDGLSAAIRNV